MKPIIQIRRNESIPIGLIVPYNSDGSVPSGWEIFSDADDKYISVAESGDTYFEKGSHNSFASVLDYINVYSSNNASGEINFWSDEELTHIGSSVSIKVGPGTGNTLYSGDADGEHKHPIVFKPILAAKQLRFIRSTIKQNIFPSNAVVLGDTDLSLVSSVSEPFSDAETKREFLKAGTILDTNVADYSDFTNRGDWDQGQHDHQWQDNYNNAGDLPAGLTSTKRVIPQVWPFPGPGGDSRHDHCNTIDVSTLTVTENMKKFYLSAWTNASTSFTGATGMIAMWEDYTAPDGWKICDGTNGTLDLRKHFIMIRSKDNHGTSTGNNSFSITTSGGHPLIDDTWVHNHLYDVLVDDSGSREESTLHTNTSVPHTHDITFTYATTEPPLFLPAHYSLVFIQKI